MARPTSRLREQLTGCLFVSLDDRNRLVLPSKVLPTLRAMSGLDAAEELEVAITVSVEEPCAAIYPAPVLEAIVEKLDAAPAYDDLAIKQRKMLTKHLEFAEVDKQGRVKLPTVLLDLFKLHGELILVGTKDHFQVWTREAGMSQLKREIDGTEARNKAVINAERTKAESAREATAAVQQ